MYIVEKVPYPSALWWAITTATTVGYGDISPATNVGKFIAAFLMIAGVGFIGLLTSTITGFFTSQTTDANKDDFSRLFEKIDQLDHKVDHLQRELNLERKKNRIKNRLRKLGIIPILSLFYYSANYSASLPRALATTAATAPPTSGATT